MSQIISIDNGRDKTKIATYNKTLSLKSAVGDWHIRNLSNIGNYEVAINGEKYFVSDLAESESYAPRRMTTKTKIHEETKILFLTAIGLTSEEVRPRIITGVPVDQFNPNTKQEMLNLLKGEYYIKINDYPQRHYIIEDFMIAPEGGGTFYHALQQFPFLEKSKVRVLDIGSRTVNHVVLNNKVFINRDSGTLDYGCMILEESNLTPEQFASKIVADISKRWLQIDKTDIVLLTGGGSIILEKYLKNQYPNCRVVDNPVFANVLGYLEMGKLKWQQQTAK